MENRIKNKLKKKRMEKERSSIIGFALAGLAIGAAAWYLFGTKEGRENFDRAVEGINEVSTKLQKKAKEKMDYANDKIKEGVDCASELTDKVKNKAEEFSAKVQDEFRDAAEEAKEKGKQMAKDAKDLANKAAHSASNLADDAESKAKKYTS